MPIYEYRCGACGHHLEALQKMSEGPLRKCPECGKSQLKRLVSASRFRLKGSGWYETDFKDKNETKRNLVEKGGAEPGEATVDKSTDTSTDKSTDTSAKDPAGKAVAETKGDAAVAKPDKPKMPAKAATRKSAAKARTKAGQR
jgi:putative FmdB family regulatory protein